MVSMWLIPFHCLYSMSLLFQPNYTTPCEWLLGLLMGILMQIYMLHVVMFILPTLKTILFPENTLGIVI